MKRSVVFCINANINSTRNRDILDSFEPFEGKPQGSPGNEIGWVVKAASGSKMKKDGFGDVYYRPVAEKNL